jgi:hypothetical protein
MSAFLQGVEIAEFLEALSKVFSVSSNVPYSPLGLDAGTRPTMASHSTLLYATAYLDSVIDVAGLRIRALNGFRRWKPETLLVRLVTQAI